MRNAAQGIVVLMILLLGGGLVVTALWRVRAAAARLTCTNRLKAIGVGLFSYVDTSAGQFPAATLPNPRLPPPRRLSWLVGLLPYIEANNLYSRTDRSKGWDAEENRFLALTVYRAYQCPAFAEGPPLSTLVPANYVGIAGLGSDAADRPLEDPKAGFLGHDRQATLVDLAGRTSSLLAAMETGQVGGAWSAGGWPTVRGLDPDDPPYLGREGQFGGLHRKGVLVLFADASVRVLRPSLAPEVLEALATIRGSGEADRASID